MRSAAIRAVLFVVLVLAGVSTSAAVAGVQLDPIGTVTSAVSTIASQTTVVSDLTSGATSDASGSEATDAVSGVADVLSGSGAASGSGTTDASADGGSRSTSSGDTPSRSATASNPGSPKTRFDRLPRRYETLLERIESGRHVRANIARLRALLASASPELRARVLRLIRLEIRRLERGGLTRRERAAVQRLDALLSMLQGQTTRGPLSLVRVEGSGILSATPSGVGVEAATAGSESPLAGHPPTSARDGAGDAIPRLPLALPPPPSGPGYWWLLLLAAVACLLLVLTGPPRQLLPSPVRGMVEVRRPEVLALAVAIGLGLVVGLIAVLLVQALRL